MTEKSAEDALLFDVAPPQPTLRTIARLVKEGGAVALTDAVRRSDQASYQEVVCRSALNRVEGMPFQWTLNPYRGCTHGCHYCFARRYQTQFELNSGDEFSSLILVKTNFAEVLRRELGKSSWQRELVAFGTATDPYQPIEGHYKLTRHSLEALRDFRTPIGLITKGPMIVRDSDLLAAMSQRGGCTVYFSVPTVDEDAWQKLEPGTAHPLQRLRAVRELVKAGVNAGVLMSPVVPGITSQPAKLERTICEIAKYGARFVGANVLYLEGGTRDHFLQFLKAEFPELIPKYDVLYAKKYAPRKYIAEVQSVIRLLQERHGGLRPRSSHKSPTPDQTPRNEITASPEQIAFGWRS